MSVDEQLTAIFFAESNDLLVEATNALLDAEAADQTETAIPQLFRAFHSIKGGAMALEFRDLAETAHCLEDVLDRARQGRLQFDAAVVNLTFQGIDLVTLQMQEYAAGQLGKSASLPERAALLAAIAALAEEKEPSPPEPEPTVSLVLPTPVVFDPNKRLFYCDLKLAPGLPMPGVSMLLILRQLENVGDILYSYPTQQDLLNFAAPATDHVRALLATPATVGAIEQAVTNPDVSERRLVELSQENDRQPARELPAVAAIDEFQRMVAQLTVALDSDRAGEQEIRRLIGQIYDWGKSVGQVEQWFSGGWPAWQGLTGMLRCCHELKAGDPAVRRQIGEGLMGLWYSVFTAVDGKRYFLSLEPDFLPLRQGISSVVERIVANQKIRLAILDLSNLDALEAADMLALADARDQLAARGVYLTLLAKGLAGRRHQNIMEAVFSLTGGLMAYAREYECCWRALAPRDREGGDNHGILETSDSDCR